MPTYSLPTLTASVFYDGTPIADGDECVPVVFVVDSNGKTASVQGALLEVQAAPPAPSFAPSSTPPRALRDLIREDLD